MKKIKTVFNFILLSFLVQLILFNYLYSIPQNNLTKLKVVTELANVRAEPDIGSPVIHLAKQGTIMDVLGQEGPWYHIKIILEEEKSIEGYVHESLVKILQPVGSVEEKKESLKEHPKKIKVISEKKEETEIPKTIAEPQIKTFPHPSKFSQIDIHISGGINFASVGDLNEGAKGFIEYYQNKLNAEKTGEFRPLHLNTLFAGNVMIPLFPRFHLGIGAEYFYGEKKNLANFSQPASYNIETKPEIKILPIQLILSYQVIPELSINGGVEYILADCAYLYRITENDTWQEWSGKAGSNQIGGFMGLKFVHDLGRHLSLFIEASSRYAKIRNLKGEGTYKDPSGLEYKEKGYMYIYQGEVAHNKEQFPLVFIRDKTPSGYGVLNPEKASLDLSGFSLQAGLRIRFRLFK